MQTKAGPISKTDKNQLLAVVSGIEKFNAEVKSLVADMDGMGTGSLGPDQVKEILSGVGNNLQAIMQKINQVAQRVPAGDGGEGDGSGDGGMGEGNESMQESATESDVGLEKGYEKPAPRETISDKQPKAPNSSKAAAQTGDKLRDMVASEVNQIIATKEAKEKIAIEAASLVPMHMRQAKYDEFINSTEDIKILSARLDGMKSFVQSKTASQRKLVLNPKKYPLFAAEIGQREASSPDTRSVLVI